MATQRNAHAPDLGREIKELRRRLDAAERAPESLNKFDRYPTAEWAAIGRGPVGGNAWSSCGISDVTGLVYDRVETKFITSNMIQGQREAEVRLAAFRHYGNAQKECVSASSALRIHGSTAPGALGTGILRWVHGIPFGWDYADGTATYTIELQHRYLVGPTPPAVNRLQVFGMWKFEQDPAAQGGGGVETDAGNGKWAVYQSGNNRSAIGYVTIPSTNTDDGSYGISTMHYCAGLPEERIPEAGPNGWAWYIGGNSSWGDAGNVNDPFVG